MTYEITIEGVHIANVFLCVVGAVLLFAACALYSASRILSIVLIVFIVVVFGWVLLDINGILYVNIK